MAIQTEIRACLDHDGCYHLAVNGRIVIAHETFMICCNVEEALLNAAKRQGKVILANNVGDAYSFDV